MNDLTTEIQFSIFPLRCLPDSTIASLSAWHLVVCQALFLLIRHPAMRDDILRPPAMSGAFSFNLTRANTCDILKSPTGWLIDNDFKQSYIITK